MTNFHRSTLSRKRFFGKYFEKHFGKNILFDSQVQLSSSKK